MTINTNVRLILEFNYRHDENIPKLECIYRERFFDRVYLIPFYDGDFPLAIAVYSPGQSYNFQGFYAEAFTRIYDERFTHYIFMADDLLLHPEIHAANILKELHLTEDAAYIKSFSCIEDGVSRGWCHAIPALAAFSRICYRQNYVRWQELLPPAEEAAKIISGHNIPWRPLTRNSFNSYFSSSRNFCTDKFVESILMEIETKGQWYPYPLVWGYSDFVIVPSRNLKRFSYYCSVLAAMGVFVEVAIPTALLLSCPNVIKENEPWKGTEMWDLQSIENIKAKYQLNLRKLMAGFAERQLYIHPIKLSQWQY